MEKDFYMHLLDGKKGVKYNQPEYWVLKIFVLFVRCVSFVCVCVSFHFCTLSVDFSNH